MAKKYKIREEVSVDGMSRFYVMSKEGWFGFWGYEEKWAGSMPSVINEAVIMTLKICKYNLEDAKTEIELLKKKDANYLKYKQDSKIVKVKYHD